MKKLTKSRTDRRVAGVCGGIAEYFNISSTVLRVMYVLAIALTSFRLWAAIWIYIALALLMPRAPYNTSYQKYQRYTQGTSYRSKERKDVTPK